MQKIHVPQRFSPIIEVDSGHAVDGEGLSKAVANSMEPLIQWLDKDQNGQAKADLPICKRR